jgi:hypothetical protein
MNRSPALEILYRASELVAQGDYCVSGIAALLTIYSPVSHVNYFAGPLLSFNPSCSLSASFPAWLIQLVHLRRLDLIIVETQHEYIGDLAVGADIMAFFYQLNETVDLPREWQNVYDRAVQETLKSGPILSRLEEGDGLKLRKGLRAEIERLSRRDDIAVLPWLDKPFLPLSSFRAGNTSLQQLGLMRLKPNER